MKGFHLNYVFYAIIFVVFIYVSVLIIKNIAKPPKNVDYSIDSSYFCNNMNGATVSKGEFSDVLASFIIGNCKEVTVYVSEGLTFQDLKQMANQLDKDRNVLKIDECELFSINTGSIFANFDEAESNDKIYLNRKEILNSDILVCLIE
ncbi:MAG: hypothetical protein QXF12_06925 [Candidatus Aenigmatarchaeota archaeon]